ncbi:MAG: alpha/beta fold hydrolase [Alphaproteobacteria bacterium]|nr:alpha/beta fold hydrolase [Alphaproteobacteria bacterium]
MAGLQPYEIAVPDVALNDLRARLRATRWPDQLPDSGWAYGADTAAIRDLCAYWADGYDWRAQERRLNAFEHFRADSDGVGVHFIKAVGDGPDPMPLLLLHGWPSSVVQMLDLIPLLTRGGPRNFTVIAPSLPGFGFSDIPTAPGMGVARMGEILDALMTQTLGFERYAARGGDIGAGVISQIAMAQPAHLIGIHTGGANPMIGDIPADATDEEKAMIDAAQAWAREEMAYFQLQATKPQTPAVGLNDSPAGMAAWIGEKFHRWAHRPIPRDGLLTNLSIYWHTQTIAASMRCYYESMRGGGGWGRVETPTAYMMSPHDMFRTPRSWIERQGPVARWTEIDAGGHFLEWEEPRLVADDMRAFFFSL